MEDVCYPDGGGTLPQNCLTLPSACLPVGTDTQACRALMAAQFVLEGSGQQAPPLADAGDQVGGRTPKDRMTT